MDESVQVFVFRGCRKGDMESYQAVFLTLLHLLSVNLMQRQPKVNIANQMHSSALFVDINAQDTRRYKAETVTVTSQKSTSSLLNYLRLHDISG